jgi:4-amino-4-deoxy-L-arabinose transferase-like glycosyltransferase
MKGHVTYLLGELRSYGWWYYFPLIVLLKTPLPFILLSAAGFLLLLRRRACAGRALGPALAAVAILLMVIPARVNIGIRYVLPIYPLLSIVAGFATVELWKSGKAFLVSRVLVSILVISQVGSSLLAHPDYLPYFNFLAGHHPAEIAVDSDLDWGQDLLRLAEAARRHNIEALGLTYFGSADVSKQTLPALRTLDPCHPMTGWMAISETLYRQGLKGFPKSPCGVGYLWLKPYSPLEEIGKSIRLYYIPDAAKLARN